MRHKIIISKTGVIKGRGSMPYRWVSGLTKDEQNHVKNGGIVLIPDNNTHYMTTDYKRVIYRNGRYNHCNYYGVI